jgi:host factor-I protein
MESKPAQNIQDTFLNTVRKDKSPITIYLVSGVKLTGKIRSFDKYSVLLENNAQEQLIFKHAISTVVSGRMPSHAELRPDQRAEQRPEQPRESRPPSPTPGPVAVPSAASSADVGGAQGR